MSKLVLGTVQFGLDYGITNTSGEITDDVVSQMLQYCAESKIELFDTAADYGNSQRRLGDLAPRNSTPSYVTKFSLPADGSEPSEENLFRNSMVLLQVEKLYGVLIHKLTDLSDPRLPETLNILRSARDAGLISRIGVSIYSLEDLKLALKVFPDLDLLQLPANILDLHLLDSEELLQLKARGVEVHVRSVFLQGMLLADPKMLTDFFDPLKPALVELNSVAAGSGKTVLELVLAKIRHHSSVDGVLVGATNLQELKEINQSWNATGEFIDFELPKVSVAILDPRTWPQMRITP